jgi:hypothetical protein
MSGERRVMSARYRVADGRRLMAGGVIAVAMLAGWSGDGQAQQRGVATQTVASPFPLKLNIPREFVDADKVIDQGLMQAPPKPRPDSLHYCDPADARAWLEQFRGKPVQLSGQGCFVVLRYTSTEADIESKLSSVEKDVEETKKWRPSTDRPGLELKIVSYAKHNIKGLPALTFVQDVTSDHGREMLYFLYVAHGNDLWTVTFSTSGTRGDRGAAIWETFIKGL